MGTGASISGQAREEGKRMGGARADFVATLGRKVAATREALRAAVAAGAEPGPREELGRKLHALGTRAELLHFGPLAEGLGRARSLVGATPAGATLGADVAAAVAAILDEAPRLVWDEGTPSSVRMTVPASTPPTPPIAPATLPFGFEARSETSPPPAGAYAPYPTPEPTLPFPIAEPGAADRPTAAAESLTLPGWDDEYAEARRSKAARRGDAPDVELEGTRLLVADDDAGVAWYFADRFRAAGCHVEEALDGQKALAKAFAFHPELIVVDILMPGLDGLSFARILRRDVALRDVPIFHTSWREDWLTRARELSSAFTGGLRKESKTDVMLARAREALRPRTRIAERLAAGGIVRGRLDGLTVCTLLDLLARRRPDAQLLVRDAAFLYTIDVRGGAPRRAVRTDSAGRSTQGPRVLAAALGACAGRFEVLPARGPVNGDLEGTLYEQLRAPLGRARETARACSGAALLTLERVSLEEEEVAPYVRTTPLFLAEVVARLAAGVSPRSLVLEGSVAPSLLEDLLLDLAARGAIRAVVEREELSIPITVGTPIPAELAARAAAKARGPRGSRPESP